MSGSFHFFTAKHVMLEACRGGSDEARMQLINTLRLMLWHAADNYHQVLVIKGGQNDVETAHWIGYFDEVSAQLRALKDDHSEGALLYWWSW